MNFHERNSSDLSKAVEITGTAFGKDLPVNSTSNLTRLRRSLVEKFPRVASLTAAFMLLGSANSSVADASSEPQQSDLLSTSNTVLLSEKKIPPLIDVNQTVALAISPNLMDGGIGSGGSSSSEDPLPSDTKIETSPASATSKPIEFLITYTGKEENSTPDIKTQSEMEAEEKVNELFDLTMPYPGLNEATIELRNMMVRQPNPKQNTESNLHLITSFGPKGQYGFSGVGVAVNTLSANNRVITVISDVKPMTSNGVEKPFLKHILLISNRPLDPNNLGMFFESVLLPLNTIKTSNDLVYERLAEKQGQISISDLDDEISKEDSGLKARIRGLARKKALDSIPELLKQNPNWKMSPSFTNIYNGYLERINNEKDLLKYLADFEV